MSRRKRGMILWIILSMVLVLAMAVGIYVFFQNGFRSALKEHLRIEQWRREM